MSSGPGASPPRAARPVRWRACPRWRRSGRRWPSRSTAGRPRRSSACSATAGSTRAGKAWSTPSRRSEAASVLQRPAGLPGPSRRSSQALDRRVEDPSVSESDRARRARRGLRPARGRRSTSRPGPASVAGSRRAAPGPGRGPRALDGLEDFWDGRRRPRDRPRDRPQSPLGLTAFAREVEAIAAECDSPGSPTPRPRHRPVPRGRRGGRDPPPLRLPAQPRGGDLPVPRVGRRHPRDRGRGRHTARLLGRAAPVPPLCWARPVEGVVLLVPTADPKGNQLLEAGFVEDVRRRLGDVEGSPQDSPPYRPSRPDLPRPSRPRPLPGRSRACWPSPGPASIDETDGPDPPSRATSRSGPALAKGRPPASGWCTSDSGSAAFTRHSTACSPTRALVARILPRCSGPGHAFSPSQIESFATCPFQFYQKYVLKLAPVDDRPELREDFAGRGDRIHKLLEEIHAAIAAEGEDVDVLEPARGLRRRAAPGRRRPRGRHPRRRRLGPAR